MATFESGSRGGCDSSALLDPQGLFLVPCLGHSDRGILKNIY
jgi:hypothetical protein